MQKSASKFYSLTIATIAVFGATFGSMSALADSVVLKGGERIEGKIINETDTEITINYQVSASIRDERTIKKTDIEKLEKATPDAEAWATLKDIKLTDDSFDPAIYSNYVNLLKDFIARFPESANAQAAKTTLAAVEAEKLRVDAGEYKFNNKWLSKEEVQKERVQLLGSAYLEQMQKFAAAGRIQDALAAFDRLEKQAGGSASYPDAVELARRSVASLKSAADNTLTKLRSFRIEEQDALKKLTEPLKTQTANNMKATRDRIDAAVAAYERSGVKWMPLSPANERSLAAISSKAASEISRLSSVQTENMKASLREAAKTQAALDSGDLVVAETALSKARQLWSRNEKLEHLTVALAAAKTAEKNKLAAEKAQAAEAALLAVEAAKKKTMPVLEPPPPEPVQQEVVKKEEPSFFSKPVAWVLLVIFLVFSTLGRKALRKFKDPERNILDQ